MVRTNRVTVLRHSEISDTTLTTQNGSAGDQAIRRLYKLQTCFCVGHLILIAVTTTTLGIYVSEHTKEIDSLYQKTGVLKSSTDHLLIKAEQEEVNDPPKLSGSETRHMYPRHNQTAIHFETQELIARIDTLATDMNKQTKTVLDNSERLARIETLIVHGSVVATTSNILGTSNETSKPTCVDFFTLNNTFMTIEANIEKQTEMTGELLHNYTARLTELETDMNAHQNAINQLSRGVSEFNDTVEQLVALETQQNDTMNTNEEIISRLEADIELHDTRLKKLETRDIRNNVTLETHSSELAKLHRDQSNDREMTTNLTFRVERLETVEERQRPSEELENRLIQLGSDINRTQVDIKGNDDKIRLLEENITSIIDIVNGYNKTVETVKGLEYSQLVDKAMNTRQDERILDLETDTSINGHILRNLTSVLEDLTGNRDMHQSVDEFEFRQNLTKDYRGALNCTWSNWTTYSTCSHSCGGGIKYRTRNCQNTNPLREDWLPKTDTDIQLCNTHTCIDYMSAFAIYWGNPLLYDSSTDRLTFSSTRINIGNHYNTTTGQFTCQYAGIYVFMLNLYKDNGAGRVWCHIRINGYNLVLANVPAESGYGWYESSGSTVLYLDPGDKVDVGSCRGANEIDIRTSFIGFLLQAV